MLLTASDIFPGQADMGSVEICCLLGNWRLVSPAALILSGCLNSTVFAHTDTRPSSAGFAIYNYVTGSALIAYGLSAKQCLAAGVLSPIVLAAMCVLCGVSEHSAVIRDQSV